MNLLQIALTTACNMECEYCPIAQWRNNGDSLTNERLMPFLQKHVNPEEWLIELTGGEPSLYKGIDELVAWLNGQGYRGAIKTNGRLPIIQTPNFKRVAAFHQLNNPPRQFDKILIIEGKDTPDMIQWCKDRSIKYCVIGFGSGRSKSRHGLELCSFIVPEGYVRQCHAMRTGGNPIETGPLKYMKACSYCKTCADFVAGYEDAE